MQLLTDMKSLLSLLAALLSSALGAQTLPADPEFRVGKLDNGLTYYVAHNENPAGCAEFYIVHNVGALEEEDSQDGLAHFLEHMAFNGTRHYPEQSLLEFLARDGVRFGYNVNAYTTRTETVYNISSVPLMRESFVDSVLMVLHDWSCDISCEQGALDAERGVITEEYRMRDDSRSRIAALQNALVYKGAKHPSRTVIGSLDVIAHFKREEILDFYHKWYRPDLQAILVVGDFDPERMEEKIKTLFADVPMPADAPKKEVHEIPHLSEPLFEDIADPRIHFNAVKIFSKQPYPGREERGSASFYRDLLCRNIVSAVLNERLKAAARAKGSPMRSAVLVTNEYEPDFYVSLFTVTPREKTQLGACLESTYREIRRLLVHGMSKAEFEAARLATAQRYHLDRPVEREDVLSADLVKVAVGHFLKNHPLMNPADLAELEARILSEITFEEVVPYPARMFRDCETIYSNCYNPETDPGIAPSAREMKEILSRVDAETLQPAFVEYATPNLQVDVQAGSIRKVVRRKGYEVWTLSNGARVYYRPMKPMTASHHLAMEFRWNSGAAAYDPEKITASRVAASYLSQHLGFRGLEKQEFRSYPELSGLGMMVSALRGKSAISMVVNEGKEENAFKAVYLSLTEPYFGKQLEKTKENQLRSLAKEKNPRTLFEERCDREVFGEHPWLAAIDSAAVEALSEELVLDVFHRAFGDFENLQLFLASDLDRALLEDYVCRYVASLRGAYPYVPSKVKAPAPNVRGERTISEEGKRQDGEASAQIYFAYLRKMRTSTRNIIISDFLDYILSARYLALIREERGGAYHVGYTTVIPENPSHPWRGVVQFKTRPDILETVIEDVPAVMKKMCEEGPTEAEMEMAARYLLKRHTELDARAERSVGTQLDRLEDTVLLGRDYDVDYKNVIGSITAREVQKMARYFAGGEILKEIYTER